jgi:hypothetical protein
MDFDDIIAAERSMTQAVTDMESQLHAVAMARQVTEFSTERRKSALSRIVVEHLNTDCSSAEAEHRARADKRFAVDCQLIMRQTAAAEEVLLAYELSKNKFESARSILSVRRAMIGMV